MMLTRFGSNNNLVELDDEYELTENMTLVLNLIQHFEDSEDSSDNNDNQPPSASSGGLPHTGADNLPPSASSGGLPQTGADNQPPSASSGGLPQTGAAGVPDGDGHEVLRLRGGGESSDWCKWLEEDEEGVAMPASRVDAGVQVEEAESSEEEEGASSSESDAATDDSSDGVVPTEPFDEVDFGDGDESHHIYSHMSGINITWYTCENDTFEEYREELCDMFGYQKE